MFNPNLATSMIIDEFVDALLANLPMLLGVDAVIPNCEVVDDDPLNVGTGTIPRYVTVTVHQYYQIAYYRGGMPLSVGDFVTVLHIREGDRFEVIGASGSSGDLEILITALSDYARGYMIRGGLYDWEAFPAHLYGHILVGDGLDVNSVDAQGDIQVNADGSVDVLRIRNRAVADLAPNNLDVLTWDTPQNRWEPAASGAGITYPPHFTKGDILLNLTFDHLLFINDDLTPRNAFLTSRRDRVWVWPSGTPHDSRGSVRLEPSLWPFRRAFGVDLDGINLVQNPSFEVDTAGWAQAGTGGLARTKEWAFWQVWALEFTATIVGGHARYDITPGAGTYSASMYMRASGPSSVLRIRNVTTAVTLATIAHAGDGQWHRLLADNFAVGAGELLRIEARDNAAAGWTPIQVDGVQLVQEVRNLPYIDGDREDGHAWAAVNHASNSIRDDCYLRLDHLANTLSDRNIHSVRTVVQMPYDADYARWPAGANIIWDVRGASDNDRMMLYYDSTNDVFRAYINGAWRMLSAVQTFDAGEWFDILVTFDFTADSYQLMINGILEDIDSTVLAPPTALVDWVVGSRYDGAIGRMSGFVYAEHTVYDHVVSLTVHRQLYLTGPTIDPESELPGRTIPYAGWCMTTGTGTTSTSSSSFIEYRGTDGDRFILAGRWGRGQWYFEITCRLDVAVGQGEAKLQFYDSSTAAWRDVPGSLVIQAVAAYDRIIAGPLTIGEQQFEYRIMVRHSTGGATFTVRSSRVYCTHGIDSGL
jgi:hypothetical protein